MRHLRLTWRRLEHSRRHRRRFSRLPLRWGAVRVGPWRSSSAGEPGGKPGRNDRFKISDEMIALFMHDGLAEGPALLQFR
jgi:hypothetical protein